MTEKDLLIQNLKREIESLKKIIKQKEQEKQEIISFIEGACVYDDHLQGYCFDLKAGDVRTLMYKIKNQGGKE